MSICIVWICLYFAFLEQDLGCRINTPKKSLQSWKELRADTKCHSDIEYCQYFPQLEYKGVLYHNISYKLLQPHFQVSHHYKLL